MKQFMTLSAFFLSAACVCVNTQSFAYTSDSVANGTNTVVKESDKMARDAAKGTENALKGAGKAIDSVARGITNATKDSVHAIENGTKKLVNKAKPKSRKNH